MVITWRAVALAALGAVAVLLVPSALVVAAWAVLVVVVVVLDA